MVTLSYLLCAAAVQVLTSAGIVIPIKVVLIFLWLGHVGRSGSHILLYYLLGKGGYVFGSVGLSCLSVCLFVCQNLEIKIFLWQ